MDRPKPPRRHSSPALGAPMLRLIAPKAIQTTRETRRLLPDVESFFADGDPGATGTIGDHGGCDKSRGAISSGRADAPRKHCSETGRNLRPPRAWREPGVASSRAASSGLPSPQMPRSPIHRRMVQNFLKPAIALRYSHAGGEPMDSPVFPPRNRWPSRAFTQIPASAGSGQG